MTRERGKMRALPVRKPPAIAGAAPAKPPPAIVMDRRRRGVGDVGESEWKDYQSLDEYSDQRVRRR